MHEKPRLQCTHDYTIFESHELNRPLREKPNLMASMARAGFMPSSPIQCQRNGSAKLKVIRGHHRLDYAKRLMDITHLGMTMAEVEKMRRGAPILKGKTRLEKTIEERPLTKVDDKAFKASVWHRDRNRCRCCGRKVLKIMGRVPERGDVHHCHGRTGDLRFEVRAAILTCLQCHEKLTGKVAFKLQAIPSKTFTIPQGTFTDATFPIAFKSVA